MAASSKAPRATNGNVCLLKQALTGSSAAATSTDNLCLSTIDNIRPPAQLHDPTADLSSSASSLKVGPDSLFLNLERVLPSFFFLYRDLIGF